MKCIYGRVDGCDCVCFKSVHFLRDFKIFLIGWFFSAFIEKNTFMMRKVDFYTVSIENAIGEVILSKASMLLVVIFNQNSSFRFQENDFVNISKCTKQIENLNQSSLRWLESIRVDHLGFLCSCKKSYPQNRTD